MPISNWPKEDRPKEKLLTQGEGLLTDAELLAIFINTGVPGKSALDLAKSLLQSYGSLKALLRAPSATLIRETGIGKSKCAALKAAVELGRRYLAEQAPPGTVLNNSQKVQAFIASRLRDHANEVFACLFLDTHLRLIRFEELFHGTINESQVYPREIVRRGLAHHAANIILAHNHPSGIALPSQADRELTQLITKALRLVDIDVIDHVIIGNPHNFSFAEAGLLPSGR